MKKQQVLFIIISALALFIVNNFILGAVVPRLPGGSSNGITTMFFVTFVSLILKRFGGIPILYLVYGCVGLPSHLLAGDWFYLVIVLLLILSSVLFDWLLKIQRYRIKAYVLSFPVFAVLMQVIYVAHSHLISGYQINFSSSVYTVLMSLLLGYSGMILAFIFHRRFAKSKLIEQIVSIS